MKKARQERAMGTQKGQCWLHEADFLRFPLESMPRERRI